MNLLVIISLHIFFRCFLKHGHIILNVRQLLFGDMFHSQCQCLCLQCISKFTDFSECSLLKDEHQRHHLNQCLFEIVRNKVPGPLLTGNCSHTFKNAKPFPHRIPACTKKCRQFSFRRQFIALLVTAMHDLLFYIINDFLICAFTCIHSIIPALALSCVIL